MSRLHIYTVHVNPALPLPYEAAQFVKEGFSWKAFIFTGLWTLYHRLWWWTLMIFSADFLILGLKNSHILSPVGFGITCLSLHIFIGFYANDWLRARLRKRGYITADIVAGDSLLRAELRFFDRYFAAHPA